MEEEVENRETSENDKVKIISSCYNKLACFIVYSLLEKNTIVDMLSEMKTQTTSLLLLQ